MGRSLTPQQLLKRIRKRGDAVSDDGLLRKELAGAVIRSADGQGPIHFILSTDTPDRSSDVVHQDGWKLKNFTNNPVVLWGHDHDLPPVGRCPELAIQTGTPNKLVTGGNGITFTERELNPFGDMVARMIRAGFLNACSVGFLPLKYELSEDPERGPWAFDFLEQDLLEFSICSVPANPEALVGAKSAGIDLGLYMKWLERACDTKRADVPMERLERAWKALTPRSVSMPGQTRKEAECECSDGPLVECADCGGTTRIRKADADGDDDGDKKIAAAVAKATEPLLKRIEQLEAKAAPAEDAVLVDAEDLEQLVEEAVTQMKAELFGRVNN